MEGVRLAYKCIAGCYTECPAYSKRIRKRLEEQALEPSAVDFDNGTAAVGIETGSIL
jgi:hypothetical protein